jgi:hypothetical protein
VAEPKKVVERVYAQLGLEMTSGYEARLAAAQQRARAHTTTHRYSLEEFGLDAAEIQTRLADLFERFHWEDAS